MDSDKNTTPEVGAAMESKDDTETFTMVKSKKTQKRKREQDGADMDTEGPVASKRPQFPPISSDKLKVNSVFILSLFCVASQRYQKWIQISVYLMLFVFVSK